MRIIAGKYRSRRLQTVAGMSTRPTADRLRETLFNVLTAGKPDALEGTVWLDLFAGSGAVGLEALSRGARKVYAVESSKRAAEIIRTNARNLGVELSCEVQERDVLKALRLLNITAIRCDFCFLDPPYVDQKAYQETLSFLSHSQLIQPAATVIAEHERRFDPGEVFEALHRVRVLEQGDVALSFYRVSSNAGESPASTS